jgi:hypothetical protein
VSSEIFCPLWSDKNFSSSITSGMLAKAHPVVTVRSAFWQIIARGAALLDLIE